MKRFGRLILAAAGGLLLASGAQAQTTNYYNVCDTSDGYKICASSQVIWNGSSLVMKVWNMEGMGTASLFGMAHTMTAVGLTQNGASEGPITKKNPAPFSSFQVLFNGLDVSTYWSAGANDLQLVLGGTVNGTAGGINGCTLIAGPTHYQTCGNYPTSPYLEFTFSGFASGFNYSGYNTFEYHSQQTGNIQKSMKVTGGPNDPPPPTVTPEPMTMILLGSGLFVIGGVHLRSRRRKNLVATEQA